MINTVYAHSTPIAHKESIEVSSFIGISITIIVAIIFYKVYGSMK